MRDFRLIARWISENYPSAEKIVEVGVGGTPRALEVLREELPGCELVATDVREVSTPEGVIFRSDDVTDPEVDIYRDADLIYSIRAPVEFYSPILELADEVGADVLVKPASSEEAPGWGEVVNYSGVAFYVLRDL